MKKTNSIIKDIILSSVVLITAYVTCLFLEALQSSQTLVAMIFVLAVFIISLLTEGYLCGITSSIIAVLINNFAFYFPYDAFDFLMIENIVTAFVTLAVASTTCMLTVNIKKHEKIKIEVEKEKMRGNLLRAISHDLRTPLTTIYGSSSAIIDNYDSLDKERILKLLNEIKEDSESLNRMVENLLSITKVSADNVKLNKISTPLEELIDTTLIKFKKFYPNYNVQVIIPEYFISIPMDALLICQVLINLLENAILHANNMQNLILKVSVDGKYAMFEVIDDGDGISNEKINNIFKVKTSDIAPVDSKRNNMGIGLSVCSAIIKAHGSELNVESGYNIGTTFSFKLKME